MIKWICLPEEGKDGKTYWNRVGKLIVGSNGKEYVKMFHIPGLCSVFEDKKKDVTETPSIDVGAGSTGDEETPF